MIQRELFDVLFRAPLPPGMCPNAEEGILQLPTSSWKVILAGWKGHQEAIPGRNALQKLGLLK